MIMTVSISLMLADAKSIPISKGGWGVNLAVVYDNNNSEISL